MLESLPNMGSPRRPFLVLLVLLLLASLASAAGSDSGGGYRSGTRPWGVLNALGRQSQLEIQLSRRAHIAGSIAPVANDQGDIAVINDDGTILVQPNQFNLGALGVHFAPSGSGYTVAKGGAFDKPAAQAGTLLVLQDDDDKNVPLGFTFPFFGSTYSSIYVNSDGNLTFGAPDVATTARDLARFLTGSPRIAPFFSDLNPADGGQVTYTTGTNKITFTWTAVPACCAPPVQATASFQATLYSDGRIDFAYDQVLIADAVVGISPGSFYSAAKIVHFTDATGNEVITLPVAEVFAQTTTISEAAAAARFYQTHEDAYDYLIFCTDFSFDMGTAFAYEVNVKSDVTGIGIAPLDYASWFYSHGHLSSYVNLGDIRRYPPDPTSTLFGLGANNTLSILGQEAGHRWLAYFRYPYNGNPQSNILLGRDDEHWSFFFNSNASVVEGNGIRDLLNGTFQTVEAVDQYGPLDRYAMGLIPAASVDASFVVANPTALDGSALIYTPASGPRTGVTFKGTKVNVTVDNVMQANGGVRLPHAAVAPHISRFAFVFLHCPTCTGSASPDPAYVSLFDAIRAQWVEFFNQATGNLAQADTRLVRGVHFDGPAAALPGAQASLRLRATSTDSSARTFTLTASGGAATVPSQVVLPGGALDVEVKATAKSAGLTRLTATAPGYEVAEAAVSVPAPADLQLQIVSGGQQQFGAPGTTLAQPLVLRVVDKYSLPVPGVNVQFSLTGGATASPSSATSDANGQVQTTVTTGPTAGGFTVTGAVPNSSAQTTVQGGSVTAAVVQQGAAVNAASFVPGAVSPGSIISVFGTNLAAAEAVGVTSPLPTLLNGTSVTMNGIAAPLYYVGPTQINAQVPFELAGNASAALVVNNGASNSDPIAVSIAPLGPGLFTIFGPTIAAARHSDGRVVQASAPASAGEYVQVYGTGLGPLDTAIATGTPAPLDRIVRTTNTVTAKIGGVNAPVVFAGLAPGFAGLYQVNVQIPSGLPAGDQNIVLSVGNLNTNTGKIAVQ